MLKNIPNPRLTLGRQAEPTYGAVISLTNGSKFEKKSFDSTIKHKLWTNIPLLQKPTRKYISDKPGGLPFDVPPVKN